MKLSVNWLREWVAAPVATDELADRLTMAGLEVESITAAAPPISGVVVGHVLATERHPQADRLSVCRVDCGAGTERVIVCGATNVRPGLKVAVAVPGATLPGDVRIREAKLRGVVSQGMICSATELRLSDDGAGILELPADAPIGDTLTDYLQLNDTILELGLTPNRGDCAGVIGIAREVAAIYRCVLRGPEPDPVSATIPDEIRIELAAPAACPRYVGRIVRNLKMGVPSPVWLQERLRRAGLRSINAVVDVTNYVMLEYGQPMHAFDLRSVTAPIRVRYAEPGERLTLLDGQQLELQPRALLIADANKALALAGIMGGESSGVSATTRDIVLESAFFAPLALAETARRHKLQTDASYRFERGVDFRGQERAIERATGLLLAICGGDAGPSVVAEESGSLPRRDAIGLRYARVERVLGTQIAAERIEGILTHLGMPPRRVPDGWQVTPPSFRFDIELEIDLIEEIARIHGYAGIPAADPVARMPVHPYPARMAAADRTRSALVARGYYESVTYSFVADDIQQLITPRQPGAPLLNPISADMSTMRNSLWPGLVEVARYNQNRQQTRIRLFELGTTFTINNNKIEEEVRVGALAMGPVYPEQWGIGPRTMDFHDIKADVDALIVADREPMEFQTCTHDALHPGQSARIIINDKTIGYVGRLHPNLEHRLGFEQAVFVFELALAALAVIPLPRYQPVSRFPAVRRDLSIVVDAGIPVAKILDTVKSAGTELLRDLQLFDEYQGQIIESGKKSVTLGLIFQAHSSTLIDEDVDKLREKILKKLCFELGATLRE